MLELKKDELGNFYELKIDGKVTRQELLEVFSLMEQAFKMEKKIKLLKWVHNFNGLELAGLWDDLKFAFGHWNDYEKVAVVTNKKWMGNIANIVTPLYPCPVEVFDESNRESARDWLAE